MIKKMHKISKKGHKRQSDNIGDDDLWGHVASGVAPLDGHHKNRTPDVEVGPPLPKAPTNRPGRTKPASRAHVSGTQEPRTRAPLAELKHGAQPGLDKSTAKKLKKGQQRIEGRMDLHGMTQEQAHRALNAFIEGSFGAAKRCVLVITGKGLKPDGSVGVLRSAVPRWLNQPPNRERVLAFSYAIPRDGGEGALYVMLKRKR